MGVLRADNGEVFPPPDHVDVRARHAAVSCRPRADRAAPAGGQEAVRLHQAQRHEVSHPVKQLRLPDEASSPRQAQEHDSADWNASLPHGQGLPKGNFIVKSVKINF